MGLEPLWILLVPVVDWALEPIPAWILRDDRQPPISTVSTAQVQPTMDQKYSRKKLHKVPKCQT